MKNKAIIGLALFFILAAAAYAFPPTPSEFYGRALINGKPVGEGTVIEAHDVDNVLCGRVTVKKKGTYGFISCNGDDPLTASDEGAEPNGVVVFFIAKKKAYTSKPAVWIESSKQEIDIFVGKPPEDEEPKRTLISVLSRYIFFIALGLLTFLLLYTYIHKDRTRYKL